MVVKQSYLVQDGEGKGHHTRTGMVCLWHISVYERYNGLLCVNLVKQLPH